MNYRLMSCAAIHDLSGLGKCSLTIALPVLSACGVETAAMPTAVLSTHTGGFTGYTFRDLSEDMMPMAEHWRQVGGRFQAVYSGFLGSAGQTEMVYKTFRLVGEEGGLLFVDPVLGDAGRLYSTITPELVDGMRELCRKADIIAPNMTEAACLLKRPYEDVEMTQERARAILEALCGLGCRRAVLTGVRSGGKLGAAGFDAEKGELFMHLLPQLPGMYHGTGDLFSSTLLGGILNGMDLSAACKLAVEFTHMSIETTRRHSDDYRFGPKFEQHLPWLSKKLEDYRGGACH